MLLDMANGQVAKINRERLKERQISLLADLTAAIKDDKKVSSVDVLSLLAGLFLFYVHKYVYKYMYKANYKTTYKYIIKYQN